MAAKHRTKQHRALQSVLQSLRLERDLTQAELAFRLDKPQSYVSKFENGERKLDLVELDQICTALGASLEALVRRYKKKSR
jgi:transcriptional regulator with XRE-family HTH domain